MSNEAPFNPIDLNNLANSIEMLLKITSSKENLNDSEQPGEADSGRDKGEKQMSVTSAQQILQELKNSLKDENVRDNNNKGFKGSLNDMIYNSSIAVFMLILLVAIIILVSKINETNQSACCWMIVVGIFAILFILTLWTLSHKRESSSRAVKEMRILELKQNVEMESLELSNLEKQLYKKASEQKLELEYKTNISKLEEQHLAQEHIRNLDNRLLDVVESYMKHSKDVATSVALSKNQKVEK